MSMSPLDTAYNRLDEAHRAWHIALAGYHRIDDFRAGINTVIQALRNLTFALQKQKDSLPDFNTWYAGWQKKMSDDEILKVFHSARTVIVHQEDLKLHSVATAKVKGWVDFQKMTFEFDPIEDSYSVATSFYNVYAKHLPVIEGMKHRLVFQFERKWVYDKLPNNELLEALAHTYHFFLEMLKDASQNFSLPTRTDLSIINQCEADFSDENVLKCMVLTPQERCLVFGFEDGATLEMETRRIHRDLVDLKKISERYGDEWKSKETLALLDGLFPEEYPFDQMKLFAQVAVGSLKKDKCLVPTSFIFKKDDKVPVIMSHVFQNQEQKVVAIDKVASEIVKNNAKYILFISEVWQYKMDEGRKIPPTQGDTKGTVEKIQITMISADKLKIVSIPFHKNMFSKIIFSKAEVVNHLTSDEHHQYILVPLIEALKKVK